MRLPSLPLAPVQQSWTSARRTGPSPAAPAPGALRLRLARRPAKRGSAPPPSPWSTPA